MPMLMPILIAVLIFIAAIIFIMSLAAPSTEQMQIRERFEQISREMDTDRTPSMTNAQFESSFANRVLLPGLDRITALIARLTPPTILEQTRIALIRAGHPRGLNVTKFTTLRLVTFVLTIVLALLGLRLYHGGPLPRPAVFGIAFLIGVLLPEVYLQREIADRQTKIRKKLPDTLDLLVVSVEAGMSFDGAVSKVTEKLKGPLADEFRRALEEMRLGKSRSQALKDMAFRINLPEITALTAAIYQADQMGVSISRILSVQSETVRYAQTQRIRLAAAKLPVTMLFPLVFFILPAIFIIMMGPGIIKIMNAFSHL